MSNPLTAAEVSMSTMTEEQLRYASDRLQHDLRDHEGRLRDTFAAAAVSGLTFNYSSPEHVATMAFNIADACMRERQRRRYVAQCEADLQKEQAK